MVNFVEDALIVPSTLIFLGAASLYEWRTRRVPNWLTLTTLGLATLWQIILGGWTWLIGVVWVICFATWQAGLLGGGDAKVLMVLGALRPDWRYLAWLAIGWMAWYSVVLIGRQPGPIPSRVQSTVALVARAMQTPRLSTDLKEPFVVVVMALTMVYWLAVAVLEAWLAQAGAAWFA